MIGFLVAGLIIGALARLILPGKQKIGLPLTLVFGIVGSVIGGVVAGLLGTGDVGELNFLGFVLSIVGAVVTLAAAERAGLGAPKSQDKLER